MLRQQNHERIVNLTEKAPSNSTLTFELNIKTMDLICRICLKVHEPCCNMFEDSENSKFVYEMVTEFTSINVRKDDGFPKNLCSSCLAKLNSAQNLKTLAIESNIKLHNFYNSRLTENNAGNTDSCNYALNVKDKISVKIEETRSNDINKKVDQNINVIEKNTLAQLKNKSLEMKNKMKSSSTKPIQDNKLKESLQNEMTNLNANDNFSDESCGLSNDCSKDADISPEDLNGTEDNDLADNSRIFNSSTDPYAMPIIRKLTRAESNSKTIYCNLCKKSFGYRYYVSVHIHQHTGNTPHKCEDCGKTFVHSSTLKKHALVHSDKKGYSCDSCGRTFKFLSGLSAHRVTHSEERPYQCTICNKAYKLDTVLKIHLRRHENTREHICEVCGFAFVEKSSLTKHMKSHNTEKSFICSTCGKGFITKRCYTAHIKLHSDFKPHACTYCEKRFHTRCVLKNHIKIHTGDKPHRCKICDKRFRQRICLVRHMRMHTGETPYACTLCDNKFKLAERLRNHMWVRHPGQSMKNQVG